MIVKFSEDWVSKFLEVAIAVVASCGAVDFLTVH